jgi:class 3 adenylate cyclase
MKGGSVDVRTKAWIDAGLYDPTSPTSAERLELLAFLEACGCSLEEMVEAERRDRLFGLAGDIELRGGRRARSVDEIAGDLGRDVASVRAIWHALGFEAVDRNDQPIATDNDIRAIRTAFGFVDALGPDSALGLLRTIGASMSRSADAASGSFRRVNEISLGRSGSELTTARAWFELMQTMTDIGHLLAVTYRHQVAASRSMYEAGATETYLLESPNELRLAVAFVDLSGFTAISQVLASVELAEMLERFEVGIHRGAARHGCRIVKFIGDAAMVVSPDRVDLADFAADIVEATGDPISARVGLGYGDVVARDGDYFGTPVNLAARLIAAAPPGSIVSTSTFVEGLSDVWSNSSIGEREFRGFDRPVDVIELRRRGG